MFWIFATVLLLGIAAALLLVKVPTTRQERNPDGDYPRTVTVKGDPLTFRAWALVPIGLWLVITLFCSINTIDAGKIGLVRTFGEITGQQSSGLNLKAPFQSVTEVNGRVQKHTVLMNGGSHGSAVSKETQPVYAVLEINYQLQLDKANTLYTEVGEGYYSRIIEPRVQQAFKAESVKYRTIDIAPKREEIREAVRADLDKALDEYGIDVTSLTIRDLDFGKKFMDAIEDKQAATEQAKAAEARVATAKAEADSAREKARGEADAITLKANALRKNPASIQQLAIEKLNPNVKVIVVPEGTDLLNLPTLTDGN